MDPERKREWIESQLTARKEVTLIGDKGPPMWHKWATNTETQKSSAAPDGSFRLDSSWELALLELVHDSNCSRYHFSAWVRHDRSAWSNSDVGIYFASGRHDVTGSVEDFCCCVILDGLTDKRKAFPNSAGNPVTLQLRRGLDSGHFRRSSAVGDQPLYLPVSDLDHAVWRKIAVDVAPEKIRFTVWKEAQRDEESQSVEVTRKAIEKAMISVCKPLPLARDDHRLVPSDPAPVVSMRGSLGLYVYRSVVSFRHVMIRPGLDKD